jgi:GNAT superfamily N-acetyltransferase
MSRSMQIRAAVPADAAAIAAIHVQSWRETYTGIMPEDVIIRHSVESRLPMWQHILAHESAFVFVAEDESGAVVGFVSGGAARELTDQFEGEIYALYLLRSHQGRGIGRALMQAVAARLHEAGYRSMMLWVLASNETRRFYAHMGGVLIGEKHEAVGESTLHEVAFGWSDITNVGCGDR